jgi:hypothetical protein
METVIAIIISIIIIIIIMGVWILLSITLSIACLYFLAFLGWLITPAKTARELREEAELDRRFRVYNYYATQADRLAFKKKLKGEQQ